MCGIAGWILKEKPSELFVYSLAYGMIERGEHSWGYFDGENIRKDVGPITQGLKAGDMLSLAAFLHTRHATTGAKTADNAHPFRIGDIVGAHNGMVYNHAELNQIHARNLSVDSMHIFQHLADGLPLQELEGYGAIEFFKGGQWYVGACNGGDLEVAKLKEGRGLVWASTRDAIQAAVFQAGWEIEHFYSIAQGRLYRIDSDELWETSEDFKMRIHFVPSVKSSMYGAASHGEYEPLTDWERQAGRDFYAGREDIGIDLGGEAEGDRDTLPFGETMAGECEFCNESHEDLREYHGSFVCVECLRVLQ